MKLEVAAVIVGTGILASIAIPNVRTARNRSAQKRTMADIRTIATAWEARATDQNKYTVGPQRPSHRVRYQELRTALSPTYVKTLPRADGWGHPFEFEATTQDYNVRSPGRDGRFDPTPYATGPTTSFDDDIAFSNGTFIHYPEGT